MADNFPAGVDLISAIVLAGGESRRMGRQKALLPWGERTVIQHIVKVLQNGGADHVIVVTGHQPDRIADTLKHEVVTWAHNPDFGSGMLSSVRCGLGAVAEQTTGVLIALVDQPSIPVPVVADLINRFQTRQSHQRSIIVPTYDGHRGHPLLFSIGFCSDILNRFDDSGLRGLLAAYPECVLEMPTVHEAVLRNMNFPTDYEYELRLLNKNHGPADSPS